MKSDNNLSEKIEILKKQLEVCKKNEELFHALVETSVGEIGTDYFNNIVKRIADWLNVECVIIGQVIGNNTVEGFPLYLDGEIIQGFTYKLKDTPCDLTSKKGYCVYVDNARECFPNSKDIIELNIKGYVGTALYNKKGKANGILCAMSRSKLQLPPQAEDILRIVGARITAEIERIKAEKALLTSQENLKKANASKDKLFSIISHDLRHPFNALIGFSNLLNKSIDNNDINKIKKYTNIIHDVSTQTFTLLNNLLEWSMTQNKTIQPYMENINLTEVTNSVIESLDQMAQHKEIKIETSIYPKLTVFVDKNMITSILRNIISNAVKFSHHGGKVNVNEVTNNNGTTISVTDKGVGIKPTDLKKLFKLESHFTTRGTESEKGTGLGLLLCKEFIDKLQGQIWAESKLEKGTTIHFTIPLNA